MERKNGSYYYGAFGEGMPDLNYRNYEVREEMKNVVRYWLNKGFDGLRIDAVRYLIETETKYYDTSYTHDFFAELREEIDKYESPKFMVCEAWLENERTNLKQYFGTESAPEFNMTFDFDQGRKMLSSVQNQKNETSTYTFENPSDYDGLAYGTFLCNHDVYEDRLGTEFNGDEYGIKLATAISLLRPTVPFIYYGQELGMGNPSGSASKLGDAQMCGSFNWDKEALQESETTSILKLNKALNSLRNKYSDIFAYGTLTNVSNGKTLAYVLNKDEESLLCVFNLTSSSVESVTLTGTEINSTESSILIGDTVSSIELTSGKAVVKNLSPYSYRVYVLGKSDEANLFDDETYSSNGTHTISYTGTYKEPQTYSSMYLRGSMNTWGSSAMTKDTDSNGNTIWSFTVNLSAAKYEFKISSSGDNWNGDNWGASTASYSLTLGAESSTLSLSGENIALTVSEAGNYKFEFNQTNLTVKVTKA